MKHTLKIITIGAGVLFAPMLAKAETIIGAGAAFGCTTITQFERIMDANKYDAKRAGKMMDEALSNKTCKFFTNGQEVKLLSEAENTHYKRIQGAATDKSYWVFKGRVQ
jgi:hypothetical protein